MTNHRNRNKTYFTVRYGRHIAKFSSNRDALRYAEAVSSTPEFHGWLIEVGHKTGLVGQYRNGSTTEEFRLHHDCRENSPD